MQYLLSVILLAAVTVSAVRTEYSKKSFVQRVSSQDEDDALTIEFVGMAGYSKYESGGVGSLILYSQDGGVTWHTSTLNGEADGILASGITSGVDEDDDVLKTPVAVIASFNGGFWTSQDAGQTWTKSGSPPNQGTFADVSCNTDLTKCAIGGDTGVYYTADGGASWSTVTAAFEVKSIWCESEGCSRIGFTGSYAGTGSQQECTQDDQGTWACTEKYSAGTDIFDRSSNEGERELLAVDTSVHTLTSDESNNVASDLNSDVLAVHCINEECLASLDLDDGAYKYSSDGGNTWSDTIYYIGFSTEHSFTGFSAVAAQYTDEVHVITDFWSSITGDTNEDVWYCTTDDGGSYMSKDILNSWTQIPNSVDCDGLNTAGEYCLNAKWRNGASSYYSADD